MSITPRGERDPAEPPRDAGQLLDCLNDNDVLALVSGALDAAARIEIDTHLDECAACGELVAAAGGAPLVQAQEQRHASRGEVTAGDREVLQRSIAAHEDGENRAAKKL